MTMVLSLLGGIVATRWQSVIPKIARGKMGLTKRHLSRSPSTAGHTQKWDGSTISQFELMERDTVIVVDHEDTVTGAETKMASHQFTTSQPHGVLHRAFSVFLFDASASELLLQKRASSKITFPSVWTNTCCSHPLHGMEENEVDGEEAIKYGDVRGVKTAAIRKLEHELGIPRSELSIDDFKFLTRVHYWAADTMTHGEKSEWGEHEVDYILFATVPSKCELTIRPNTKEVDDIRWVNNHQLLEMFSDQSLRFSPWFRIIANRWMIGKRDEAGWWDDLNRTMTTDDFCDFSTIHRFDPPREHFGGGGDAGPLFSVS